MTKHNSKKLLNLTAAAAVTAAAGAAMTAGTAHADAVTTDDANPTPAQSQKQVTPQEQYQQAVTDAQNQIDHQAQANQTAEDNLAKQNDAANDADAKTTDEAVTKLQDQINEEAGPKKAQADADYAAKEKTVNQQTADATKAENNAYQDAVNKQTAANQAAEDQMAKENAQKLADAAKHVTTPAQKESLKDAAKSKQSTDLAQAQTNKTKAEQAAKDALNHANGNAQAAHNQAIQAQKDTNAKRLADAQKAYQNAVKNAPKTGVAVPAIPDDLVDQDSTSSDPYLNTGNYISNYGFCPVNGGMGGVPSRPSKTVLHSLNELPISGKPGVIYYDPESDESERIDLYNLTDAQYKFLNQYLVNQVNAIRDNFWNNIAKDKTVILDGGGGEFINPKVNKLTVSNSYFKIIEEMIHFRNIHHLYDKDGRYENGLSNIHIGAHPDYPDYPASDMDKAYENWAGGFENQFTPNTMLQAVCMIHNVVQSFTYGELNNNIINGNIIHLAWPESGHLSCFIAPYMNQVGFGIDKGRGFCVYFNPEKADPNDIVHTSQMAQILAAQSGQGTPDLNDPSVKAAAKHVEDVKTQNAQDLAKVENESPASAGQTAYDQAMQKADADYQAAVKQINAAYDAEIKRINALPENNDQLKADLDQQLVALKKDNQAKLDTLKQNHDAKLAKIKDDAAKELADYKAQLQ